IVVYTSLCTDTTTPLLISLSLHDALPIFGDFTINAIAGGNQMRNTYDGIELSSGQLNIPFRYFIGNGSSQNFDKDYGKYGINSLDRKSTRLNSSHVKISYAVFCS